MLVDTTLANANISYSACVSWVIHIALLTLVLVNISFDFFPPRYHPEHDKRAKWLPCEYGQLQQETQRGSDRMLMLPSLKKRLLFLDLHPRHFLQP